MLELIQNPIHTSKHARLRRRPIKSFRDVDNKIRISLQELEDQNSNLWTSPDYNKNEFVHSVFQYPAMMVPEVQRQIVDVIIRNSNSQNISSMIDPFMGSATSLVSSMHYGIDCYGQDINPLAILIAKVRTTLVNIDFKRLKKRSKNLISIFQSDNCELIEADFNGRDKWFKREVSLELSKIVRAIRVEEDITIRRFYWANLAEVIRICSNDRTSTYKLHARKKEEIENRINSPIKEMVKQLQESTEGYLEFKNFLRKKGRLTKKGYKGCIKINYSDSSKSLAFGKERESFAELLVSSPPYGDNHTTVTYGQYSYLQLQWIDLKDIDINISRECLRTTQEIDYNSLGGKRRDPLAFEKAKIIAKLSISFKEDLNEFNLLDKDRFCKIVIFIDDLIKVIDNSINALKTNSYMIWTIGNRSVGNCKVRNVNYMKEILEAKGCAFVHSVSRTILNKRMAKSNKDTSLMNVEDILIFRKVG